MPATPAAQHKESEWTPPDDLKKGAELAQVEATALVAKGLPAYGAYSKELIELYKKALLPPEATDADLYFLFQLAGRYGLDPFAKEIWLVPMPGKNGGPKKVAPIIGRDGMLKVANDSPLYRGNRSEAVYENDSLEKTSEPFVLPDGNYSFVRHSFKMGAQENRGKLVGAWSEVYLEGRPPSFFYAPLAQYMPKSESKRTYSPWGTQEDVMIVKVALRTALVMAVPLSGLHVDGDMARAMERGKTVDEGEPGPIQLDAIDYGDDPAMAARIEQLFDAADAVKQGTYLPAKRKLLAEGLDPEGRALLEVELALFIEKNGGTVPDPPEPVEVVGGEVVEEQA